MATIQTLYGTSNQAITITLASLAASAVGAGRSSAVIDNSTNLFLDALAMVVVEFTAAATASADRAVYVYAYGTVDGGTTYSDIASGADAALTLDQPTQLRMIGSIAIPTTIPAASRNIFRSSPMSVAAAFGGILPQKWGIFVQNNTGIALTGTATNKAMYQGISGQSV